MYSFPLNVRRVQQVLHETGHLGYAQMRTAPKLALRHRSERIDLAVMQLRLRPALLHVTRFSDEAS